MIKGIIYVVNYYMKSLGVTENTERTLLTKHYERLSLELAELINLEELESRVYLQLLQSGPITISSLAKKYTFEGMSE